MKRIVVLISGRGSNLRSLVRACTAERWPARVAAVISDRPQAAGLAFAREQGIAAQVVDPRAFASRAEFDAALSVAVETHAPDIVLLAGFMRILDDAFVRRHAGRMLNVHPSLLPAFAGLHTHRRALEAGCKIVGATVHFVTPALDHGPIVIQAAVPVRADDTESTLAARVLACEHVIYPRAARWLVEGALHIDGAVVRHLGGEAQWLMGADEAGTPTVAATG
jgi:phosphoribosylglycinamide formyltransferase-1